MEKEITKLKKLVKVGLSRPIFGYWDIRGLGQGIRYQLKYQGVDFVDRHYKTTDKKEEMHSKSGWADDKKDGLGLDFPNLPYFVDTDGTQLTEHLAIHMYVAEKYMPDLLGRNAQERAQVDMMSGVLKDLKFAIVRPMFNPATVKEEMLGSVFEKLGPVADFLGHKEFLLGENVTYVDFILYEIIISLDWLTNQALYNDNDGRFAKFKNYMDKIYNLPGVSGETDRV